MSFKDCNVDLAINYKNIRGRKSKRAPKDQWDGALSQQMVVHGPTEINALEALRTGDVQATASA